MSVLPEGCLQGKRGFDFGGALDPLLFTVGPVLHSPSVPSSWRAGSGLVSAHWPYPPSLSLCS